MALGAKPATSVRLGPVCPELLQGSQLSQRCSPRASSGPQQCPEDDVHGGVTARGEAGDRWGARRERSDCLPPGVGAGPGTHR